VAAFCKATIIIIIIIISSITLPIVYLLGNLHLSQTVGRLDSVRGRQFIVNPKVKGHDLGICVLYDTFVTVLLFARLDVFG
jgi:hypothetical protein